MPSSTPKTRLIRALIFVSAAGLYAALWSRIVIGTNDDALYILGAKSLLAGHYVDLSEALLPPMTLPLPGFSMVLAPFVAIFEPHWDVLKIIPLLMTLLSGLLLMKLLEKNFKPAFINIVLALFLFNAVTAENSVQLMSESTFMCFSLAAFLLLKKIEDGARQNWPSILLGLILGWAALIRPQGCSLIIGMGLGLAAIKRWRELIMAVGLSVSIYGGMYVRNYGVSHSASAYFSLWHDFLPYLGSHYDLFFSHVLRLVKTFFGFSFFPAQFHLIKIGCMMVIGLIIRGIYFMVKKKNWGEALTIAVFGHFFLTLLIHVLWPQVESRYVLPLLPFAIVFIVAGMSPTSKQTTMEIAGLYLGVFIFLMGALSADARMVYQTLHQTPQIDVPLKTYEWIRNNTPEKSNIFDGKPPALTLYTGRFGEFDIRVQDQDEFKYLLAKRNVSYVHLHPITFAAFTIPGQLDVNARYSFLAHLIVQDPVSFPVLYTDPVERTQIRKFVPDPHHLKAYEIYLSAQENLYKSEWKAAEQKLNQAMRIDPHLPTVNNALGIVYAQADHDMLKAKKMFEKALALSPQFTFAQTNLDMANNQLKNK